MKDITIIVPIHKFSEESDGKLLRLALNSVVKCQENYDDKLSVVTVGPVDIKEVVENILTEVFGGTELKFEYIVNKGKCDFCSQINFAVKHVKTSFFSILEMDDQYFPKWFKLAKAYYPTREDVAVFLPINIQNDGETSQYCNEMVWAMSFSNEQGVVDADCLKVSAAFNLTGAIFNTKDFKRVKGYDSKIDVAFNYELLMRMTKEYGLKIYVVPRIGYCHLIGRKGSLLEYYNDTFTEEAAQECFNAVRRKYVTDDEDSSDK